MCVLDGVADKAQSKDHARSPSGGVLPPGGEKVVGDTAQGM